MELFKIFFQKNSFLTQKVHKNSVTRGKCIFFENMKNCHFFLGQRGGKIKIFLKSSYWVVLKWPQGGGLTRGKVSLWASPPFPPPCPRMYTLFPSPIMFSTFFLDSISGSTLGLWGFTSSPVHSPVQLPSFLSFVFVPLFCSFSNSFLAKIFGSILVSVFSS